MAHEKKTMNVKQIFGIILSLCGVAVIVFSLYVNSKVSLGKEKISSAQSAVDKGNWLLDMTPVTKEIDKGLSSPAQNKINEGWQQIAYYEGISRHLLWSGIGLFIIGCAIVLIFRKKPGGGSYH